MLMDTPLGKVFEGHEADIPFAFKEQFLATPDQDYDIVLRGVMHKIWHRPRWLKPLFYLLGKMGILVPKTGENIPTTLAVIPGFTRDGDAYHEWNRTLAFQNPIEFNTTVIYDRKKQNIADLVGPGKFLHMVWDGKFIPPYRFTLDTIVNGFRIRGKVIYLPKWFWYLLFGRVKFIQQAHGQDKNLVDVDLRIIHPILGEVFGYQGTFQTRRYHKEKGNER
jgi:hypothetical protein